MTYGRHIDTLIITAPATTRTTHPLFIDLLRLMSRVSKQTRDEIVPTIGQGIYTTNEFWQQTYRWSLVCSCRTISCECNVKQSLAPLSSIRAAKWPTALCKMGHFAGQTGNAWAENAFAALILIGCRDVKQLTNKVLKINARVGANFCGVCTCSLCIFVVNFWRLDKSPKDPNWTTSNWMKLSKKLSRKISREQLRGE